MGHGGALARSATQRGRIVIYGTFRACFSGLHAGCATLSGNYILRPSAPSPHVGKAA